MTTYRAYIQLDDGQEMQWTGLSYTKARWRYHWIKRELVRPLKGPRWKTYGYEREKETAQ